MEDYEKKYKDLIRDIDTAIEGQREGETKTVLQNIKQRNMESEDERIRKELIEALRQLDREKCPVDTYPYLDWIAWIEKQKDTLKDTLKDIEHNPAWSEEDDENIMMIEDRFSDYLNYIREDSSLTKYRKNTLKEDVIGYVNWLKSFKDRVQPQQKWSEEDKKMLERLIEIFSDVESLSTQYLKLDEAEKIYAWLKSFKDRVQPQQKWSEDDEKYANYILMNCIHYAEVNGHVEELHNTELHEQAKEWLKSLKPQNRWKPSESDIALLERVIQGKSDPKDFQASLQGILGNLKKL